MSEVSLTLRRDAQYAYRIHPSLRRGERKRLVNLITINKQASRRASVANWLCSPRAKMRSVPEPSELPTQEAF